MSTEIWRTPIVNDEPYEDYQVSNLGRLMSLNYNRTGRAELLNPHKRKDGYLQVALCKNKIPQDFLLHRIIAETFLPNPDSKPCINHKIDTEEGRKMNMVFFNEDGSVDEEKSTIEWCTYEENNNYGSHGERIRKANTNGKLSKRVLQFTLDGVLVKEWVSAAECGRQGYNCAHVADCCRGERKSHKGFKWCYA